jgi:hypothetical protein
LNEKNSALNECDRRVRELEAIIRDRERDIVNTNDQLQQFEQRFNVEKKCFSLKYIFIFFKIQQRELEEHRQHRDILSVNLNIALEENEVCNSETKFLKFFLSFQANLDRIKLLEKQLEMSQVSQFFLHSLF